ncbi:hypothetical protein A1O1_03398 [Capronia coronata CBS 617.96]|uniref:Zn(2)-C6 fungal-type domain-containing protein n=1 Tax=Capronia coronata CBS 617.96 TaxID=1182541 RepID=W9Z704_9EURO|nr:uncharacterized protein A1O1_03398 [Capronia coronata CBS 617.96]EXJ90299.1 hypothetical protein A1O1_03398 [Capronia coronata CBS 617.96]
MATTAKVDNMQNTLKRKVSVAGMPMGGRTVKRRASKACHCCRSRKVRCDVVESGVPCTNCRLDEVECVVTEGKRRRKSHADGDKFHHSSRGSSVKEEKNDLPEFPIFDNVDWLVDLDPVVDQSEHNQSHALEFELNHHSPHMLYQTQGHRITAEERSRRMSAMSSRALPTHLQLPARLSYSPQPSRRPEIALPQYIQPIPPRIMTEDLEYLQKKGAFSIPDAGFRNELLRCYVQYVHPYLPIIDLKDFLAAIEKNEPANAISLLLFQAVMFAGTAYVDMRYLVAQGYETRKEVRKSFFQKIRHLYDLDYELDRVVLVQAILLMTYWYDSPDDPKDVWHWLGVGISVARTIGLNCNTSDATSMSMRQRRLWKRIWWSLYMRDRLLAIGMRRPMRITEGECGVSMLELSDFEVEALPVELTRTLGGCPLVKDTSKRVTLARMCIALAELCVWISQVLAVQYSTLGHKIGATQETTMRLVPNRSAADPRDVIRCDRELESWYNGLPRNLRFLSPASHERTSNTDGEVVNVHRALLTGVYLTVISALHRPQILPSAPDVVIAPELRKLSKKKVREAANDITDMYQELFVNDQIRYLPNTGVTCLLPALIIHLLDIKSTDASIRQASVRKFQMCMQALQRLREMYASADFAFSFLDAAIRKTNAQLGTPSFAAPRLPPGKCSSRSTVAGSEPHSVSPLLLTPPPEAMQTASMLLSHSTLAPAERKLVAAYTPPGSDVSHHSHATDGAAASPQDLAEDPKHGQSDGDGVDEPRKSDFESLFNAEGETESHLAGEDGLDLHVQWLNGFDGNDHVINDELSFLDRLAGLDERQTASGYAEQSLDITGDLDLDLDVRAEW